MKKTTLSVLLAMLPVFLFSQGPVPPLVAGNYQKVTSYDELSTFIRHIDEQSGLLTVETAGQSVEGRNIYTLSFSLSGFGLDTSKIRVLIFAQQHGNEQSGKEGALLLAMELIKPENRYLFEKIDLMLVPQVNPDGSEVNQRRNANGADLNRNHLILTEPETRTLHRLFDQYRFEVALDVHEYSPYGEAWKKYGYRKNSDITLGTLTNTNVDRKIRLLSNEGFLPYILSYLKEHHFSSFEYCPGGPPGIHYIRHSTFDINDGRQSLGIQNTFSFIQEGMNGTDDFIENIRHRALGQMTGMQGLLEYSFRHKDQIKRLVDSARKTLIAGTPNEPVSIQSEHIQTGQPLIIPLFSYFSGKDTVITVADYRPVVASLLDIGKPLGYLIPVQSLLLMEWADRQKLVSSPYIENPGHKIEQYFIPGIDSIDFEGDRIVDPNITVKEFQGKIVPGAYYLVPTAQLKGNLVVLALEPKSMLGLVTYNTYAYLLKEGTDFPILRVTQK